MPVSQGSKKLVQQIQMSVPGMMIEKERIARAQFPLDGLPNQRVQFFQVRRGSTDCRFPGRARATRLLHTASQIRITVGSAIL